MPEPEIFSQQAVEEGITLLHHRSDRWKTEFVKIVFIGDPSRLAAGKALGASLLRHGTRRCQGQDAVARHMQALYGTVMTAYVARSPMHHLTHLNGVVISPEFIPRKRDILAHMLRFLGDELHRPWMSSGSFDQDLFELERNNVMRAIDSIRDNKAQYADLRLSQEMFSGHPMSLPVYGLKEDVAALGFDEVVNAHVEGIRTSPVSIYVVSPRSGREVLSLVKKNLDLAPRKVPRSRRFSAPAMRSRARTVVERESLNQSRLAMGFRIVDYNRRRDAHAARLGDVIFGGASVSKLFKVVRERHSLAYSIMSSLEPRTGSIQVSAGIEGSTFERVRRLVRRQVRAMAEGRFGQADLEIALAHIEKSYHSAFDSQAALVNVDLGLALAGHRKRSIEGILARYSRIGKDAVCDVFRRVKLDTTFLLEQE